MTGSRRKIFKTGPFPVNLPPHRLVMLRVSRLSCNRFASILPVSRPLPAPPPPSLLRLAHLIGYVMSIFVPACGNALSSATACTAEVASFSRALGLASQTSRPSWISLYHSSLDDGRSLDLTLGASAAPEPARRQCSHALPAPCARPALSARPALCGFPVLCVRPRLE